MTVLQNTLPSEEIRKRMLELKLSGVKRLEIPMLWDNLEVIIDNATGLCSGRMDARDILFDAIEGKMQIWTVGDNPEALDGVIVTQVVDYPSAKALRYILVSGNNVDVWIDAESIINEWARGQGCILAEGSGRMGWHTKLKTKGWKSVMRLYEKDISDANS